MTDFYSLSPMEPINKKIVPTGDYWCYQIKWDGIRLLSYFDGNTVSLRTKRGYKRGPSEYPELQLLPEQIKTKIPKQSNKSWIVDGELVVHDLEMPGDFYRVLQRDRTKKPTKELLTHSPIKYKIFDVLYFNSTWLIDLPLVDRWNLLADIMEPNGTFQLVPFYFNGQDLLEWTKEQNHEGIIAKKKSSQYYFGKNHHHWYKIKHIRHLDCYLCGVVLENNKLKSLLLGKKTDFGGMVYIGKASSGLSQKEHRLLKSYAYKHKQTNSPFIQDSSILPTINKYQELIFLEPNLKLRIKYLDWTAHNILRHPVIEGFLINC